jgi:hypothetical protein
MNSWKSASLPLCGVAVISRKCRVRRREQLPEPVALGVFDLAAEHRRRHLVRLVADHQVPAAVGRLELLLHILVARQLVEAGDDQVGFDEPVAGARRFELVVGENLEGQVKAPVELVLPLLGQAAGADDQAALQVAAGDQLLDEQPAMMVLPAPGSSASRKRSGWRGSIAS